MPKQTTKNSDSGEIRPLRSLITDLIQALEPHQRANLELRQLSLELSWMLGRLDQGRSPFPENWHLILFAITDKAPLSRMPPLNRLARQIQYLLLRQRAGTEGIAG
jgi:hypothetical protein